MQKLQRILLGTTVTLGLALAGGSAFAADLMAPPPEAPATISTSGAGVVAEFFVDQRHIQRAILARTA